MIDNRITGSNEQEQANEKTQVNKMVLTGAQTTAFFENAGSMGLNHNTRVALQAEGINAIEDLHDFEEIDIKSVATIVRKQRPPGMVNGPYLALSTLSQNKLSAASEYMRYFQTVGRETSAATVSYDPIIKKFTQHWSALKARKAAAEPEIPKITKTLPVTKWTESFADFLQRVCGVRTIPLSYVIRDEVAVVMPAPAMAAAEPFSTLHGSVEAELVARALHTHPLYIEDNAKLYHFLEEATRTTSYAASIKPMQRRKDGRAAWFALVSQYAGVDKWQAELLKQDDLIHTRKWKGQSNFSLEKFIGSHRFAYVSMCQCAQHVNFQLPNETTRVTFLLNGIECNDAPLQAAMALVRNDTGPTGMMNDFEATAAFILPHDPVAKKRNETGKRGPAGANISDVTGDDSGDGETTKKKNGIGRTGVEFRFYDRAAYRALSDEQKDELREYRDGLKNGGGGNKKKVKFDNKNKRKGGKSPQGGGDSGKKKMKTLIAEAVAREIKGANKAEETEAAAEKQLNDFLVAAIESVLKKKTTPSKPAAVGATDGEETIAPVKLSSILKNLKNKKE